MSVEWYYARNNQKYGPFSPAQLKQLAASGQLQPTDMLHRAGMQKWMPAAQVQGLFTVTPSVGEGVTVPLPPPLPPPVPPPVPFEDFAGQPASERLNRKKAKSGGSKWMVWAGASGVMLTGLTLMVVYLTGLVGGRGKPSGGSRHPGMSWDSHSVIPCELKYPNGAKAVAISPDGTVVACCGNKFPLTLYAVSSSGVKATLETETGPSSRSIAYSPNGRDIAYVAGKKVTVKNVTTVEIRAALDVHQSPKGDSLFNTYLAFSPDGKLLATASNSSNRNAPARQVKLWDATTWQLKADLPGCHPIAFSPDGKIVAMRTGSPYTRKEGSEDSSLTLWDIAAGKELTKFQAEGKGPSRYGIEALAFSHDGTLLAALHGQEVVNLWDVKKGTVRRQIKPDFGVVTIAFSPDGKGLAAVGGVPKNTTTGIAVIWDLESDTEARLEGHSGWIEAVAFSKTADLLATMSCDKTVRLWKKRPDERGKFVFRTKRAALGGDSPPADQDDAVKATVYTKKAKSLRKGFQGKVRTVDPGSRADFMLAVEVLGGTFGHKMNEGGIVKHQLALQCNLDTWTQVFGEPSQLSDGFDSFTKRKYQRWRHTCKDGPVTIHGNMVVVPRQQGSILQCTRLCLY